MKVYLIVVTTAGRIRDAGIMSGGDPRRLSSYQHVGWKWEVRVTSLTWEAS